MSFTVAGPDTDASGARVLIPPNRQGLDASSTRGPARRATMIAALVAADAGAAAAAGVGGSIVVGSGPLGVWDTLALPILACLTLAAAGLYGGDGPGPAERLRLRTYGVLALSSGCLVFSAGLGAMPTRAIGIVTTGILLLVVGFYAEVTLRSLLIRRGLWGARTAIVGTDACATALADTLLAQPELGLRPIAFIAAPSDGVPRQGPDELPVIGSIGEAMRRADIEVAIVCSSSDPVLDDLARPGPLPFPRVVVAQQTQDLQTLWIQTRTLGSVLGLELRRDLYGRRNLRIKRCLDTVLAWPAVLVTAPLIAALALAIRLVDPGPSFYVQQRVGRNGKPIRVLKLRSMYGDAERRLRDHLAADARARDEWSRFFKLTHDPRILPIIGRFIRRTSLDELPQLWNVVRGEMSLVGPRPFPSYHTASFDDRFQALRQSVPPGLTGLWQVSARSSGDLAVQQAQDTFYIRNWSLWLDFYILLVTVPAVSSGAGAR